MKTVQPEIIKLNSIDAYNKIYGLETYHPLVTVVDLKNARYKVDRVRLDYGLYALFLKNGVNCTLKYGRQSYDYQEGTIVSFSPGQMVDVEAIDDNTPLDVIGLLFHPDLIYGTPLANKIKNYGFFEYSQREAVHLSEEERRLFLECLDRISQEIKHPVDNHTAEIVASHIQLLLDYLARFYERQFITRRKANSDILQKFERALKEYYQEGKSHDGFPSVNYFADKVNLTPGYFGDMVKKETGKTAKEFISLHIIDMAKQRLSVSDEDISIIAYELGFQYPQHFSRMFKRVTGITPTQFREGLPSA